METTQSKCPACGGPELEKLHEKLTSLKRLPRLAMLLILAAMCLLTSCALEPGELPEQTAVIEKLTSTQEPDSLEPKLPPVEEWLAESLHEPWAARDWEKVIGLIEDILTVNPNYDDVVNHQAHDVDQSKLGQLSALFTGTRFWICPQPVPGEVAENGRAD